MGTERTNGLRGLPAFFQVHDTCGIVQVAVNNILSPNGELVFQHADAFLLREMGGGRTINLSSPDKGRDRARPGTIIGTSGSERRVAISLA